MANNTWHIDPVHSDVQFKIKHLVISNVTGVFKEFSGKINTEADDFETAAVDFEIAVKSIDTNQPVRDEHLRSSDFFEADKHPTIKFVSTAFKKKATDLYDIEGVLTMKGVSKPVAFNGLYGGTATTPEGVVKVGFEITGVVDRKDFGITFNGLTETGGLMLGEKINITANIQMDKQ